MSITRSNQQASAAESARSLGPMVSGVTEDLSLLVHDQIALTKSELRQSAKVAATSSAMLVAAAVVAFLALVFLLVTAAYGLVAAGLPTWAGFGIVTLVLIIVTVVLGLVGAKRLRRVRGPERSAYQLSETKAMLARRGSGG
jgi:hypothetical protein